jgi:hypothetical protein
MARSSKPKAYTFAQLLADVKRRRSIRKGKVNSYDEGRLQSACAKEYGTDISFESVVGLRTILCRKMAIPPKAVEEMDAQEAIDRICGIKRCPPELAFQELTPGSPEKVPKIWLDALAHNQYLIDYIHIGMGAWQTVSRADCIIVPGTTPSLCPDADPVMPAHLLPSVKEAFCELKLLNAGQTIHWVGVKTYLRKRCRCFGTGAPARSPGRASAAATTDTSDIMPIAIEGERVLVKGKVVRLDVTSEGMKDILHFLDQLIGMRGQWLSGPDISKANSQKYPDRYRWDRLPLPRRIKRHIESKHKLGYRIKAAK